MSGVLVVGAGLGGLRAAEALRANGYSGPITVVGDEPYLPYTRPPLSKDSLRGGVDIDGLLFRRKAAVDDVTWLLGRRAVSCSLAEHTVALDDATVLTFDGLVIASGIRPRRLPIPGPTEGRMVLRTADDARRLHDRIRSGTRVVIMGAGFIGCETAATARGLGSDVCIVALEDEPMVRPLGSELGAAMRRRHEHHGVRFRLGCTIDAFEGGDHVQMAVVSDGSEVPADVVIEAVGSVANVEWLDGNGLDLTDGVVVDSSMQVGTDLAAVVAVGDVARHPNAHFGPVPRRVEHWSMPTETGRRAGRTLAALLAGQEPDRAPFTAMPSFWSDQYESTLQSFGMPGLATRIEVAHGHVDGSCIVEYHDDDGLVGVVGIDMTRETAGYRGRLMERSTV